MTRLLVALLTLAACSPERDEMHDVECQGAASDWIGVPERVEMAAQPAGSYGSEPFSVDGVGVVCDVSCTEWEHAGVLLHWQDADPLAIAAGEWAPEDDDIGQAAALPADLVSYSANGSEPGMVSVCTVYSSAGEDVIEVVVIE